MRIVVVGGGVTGLFVSYQLAAGGHEVTIVERGSPGESSAVFSAGLITPSTGVAPSIGMGEILSSFLGRRSAVSISMVEVLRNLRWFRIASRRGLSGYEATITAFGRRSLELYREFFERERLAVDRLEGIAGLYESPERAKRVAEAGGARLMDGKELSEMGFAGFGGGVFAEDELSIEPGSLLAGLAGRVAEMGVRIRRGEPRLEREGVGGRTVSVVLDGEALPTDHCVVTAGSWSRAVCRTLGHDPLLLPARGWSMLFETDERIIGCPALLEDTGIAAIQHSDRRFRLTSFFEMRGFERGFSGWRRRWMVEQAEKHLPRFKGAARPTGFGIGFRPCTPDQLPIVGRVPGFENLHLATGSCRLGVTLAPATAELVRAEIEGSPVGSEFAARFSPARFVKVDRTGRVPK
ncbi:MAG: FAD-binding oxidoreductase [Nitrososphaerales archaeon]|jgi:D-amino-acid dehydrogenase